jgi:hypothetical protein
LILYFLLHFTSLSLFFGIKNQPKSNLSHIMSSFRKKWGNHDIHSEQQLLKNTFCFEACWLAIITYPSQNTKKSTATTHFTHFPIHKKKIFSVIVFFISCFFSSHTHFPVENDTKFSWVVLSVHFWNKLLTFIVSSSQWEEYKDCR